MKNKFTFLALLPLIGLLIMSCQENSNPVNESISANNTIQKTTLQKDGGFDQFGYNYTARIFNGIADGVDRTFGGTSPYDNDHLVMKWNAEWDRGNDEGWANPPYSAWTTNEWNGKVKGGSGDVWHYKIIWVGPELENSPYWKAGGYALWGQFETIMDQGSSMNEHFWYAHAKPNGLITK